MRFVRKMEASARKRLLNGLKLICNNLGVSWHADKCAAYEVGQRYLSSLTLGAVNIYGETVDEGQETSF